MCLQWEIAHELRKSLSFQSIQLCVYSIYPSNNRSKKYNRELVLAILKIGVNHKLGTQGHSMQFLGGQSFISVSQNSIGSNSCHMVQTIDQSSHCQSLHPRPPPPRNSLALPHDYLLAWLHHPTWDPPLASLLRSSATPQFT
jgi:hypothetical protein